ncbi:MAG: SCP2 sterol-binding domain-containing protein [Oscillospiraceae bacterium]
MSNTEKKTTSAAPEVKKTETVKTAETKPATTPAAAAPKAAETKPAEVKAAAPAPKKEEKKPAEKKPAAKKPAEKKPAEKKPVEKKPAAKKPAAKTEAKPAAKTAAKAPKAPKAPKVSPYEAAVAKSQKKFASVKTDKVKYPIAVNVELSGSAEGIFYVYLSEAGKPAVEPYRYDDYDVYVRADADAFNKVLDGKLSVYDALADGSLHVEGTVKKALMFFLSAF